MKKENIILIILTILATILGVFLLIISNKKTETSVTDIDINSELVQNLYEMANPSNDSKLLDELYSDKLTNQYIIAMGISNYLKNNEPISIEYLENTYGPKTYIPAEDVQKNIKLILGNIEYKNQDVFILDDDICGYNYNEELNRYEDKGGCGGTADSKYYRKIVSAYIKNDRLYIREKMFYATFDFNNNYNKISIFDNNDMKNIIDYIEKENDNSNIDINNYIDKGSLYEYEFKKLDNNNNYIFLGITRKK